MSPASRYIAMARQGLLGCDSQETPKRVADLKDDARQGIIIMLLTIITSVSRCVVIVDTQFRRMCEVT